MFDLNGAINDQSMIKLAKTPGFLHQHYKNIEGTESGKNLNFSYPLMESLINWLNMFQFSAIEVFLWKFYYFYMDYIIYFNQLHDEKCVARKTFVWHV